MANFPSIRLDLSTLEDRQIDVFLRTFPLVLAKLAGPDAVRFLKRAAPKRTGRLGDSAFFIGVPEFGVQFGYQIFYASFQPGRGKSTREFAESPRFAAHVSKAVDISYIAARKSVPVSS